MELILKYFPSLTPLQLAQLASLDELYKEWNSKINVISRKDINGLYEKHVLHSLSIASIADFKSGTEVLDIGTGGGFPGLPLAILFPDTQFILSDSIGKKLKVIDEIRMAIGLLNVVTLHTRVEAIKNQKFDFTVSRAVAPLKDLWKWSQPLLKKGYGKYREPSLLFPFQKINFPALICLKGGDLLQEIADSATRPEIIEIHKLFPEPFFENKYILYMSEQ